MPRMHMTFQDGLFAVRTYNRDDGQAAKAAGANWHGPHNDPRWPASTCEACAVQLPLKDWWYFKKKSAGLAVRLREIADEHALAALEPAVARLEVSRSAGEEPARGEAAQGLLEAPVPSPPGMVYKPYQRAGIAFMMAVEGGALLADEPGLGKTISLLGLINAHQIRRSLIVVPASLRLNWLREAAKWLSRPTRIHVVGEPKIILNISSSIHRVTAGPVLPPDVCEGDVIVIANYDRVRDPSVLAQLMACRWDLLASDEAHFLKNPKSQRTVAVLGKEVKGVLTEKGLRQVSDKLIAMTGTPLPNKPVEMWPILHAVAPKTFPAFFPYVRRYCDAKQVFISPRVGSKWDFNGASNLAELQELLRSTCMVRRLKADVLADLPPKIRQIITLPTEGFEDLISEEEEGDDGDDFVQTLAGALDTLGKVVSAEEAYANAAALLGKAGKLNFKTVARTREKLALRKLPEVLEICDNRLQEEKKIIIFAHHHSVVEKVLAHYNKKGKAPMAVAVYGPVDARKRDDAVTAFQTDDSIRVFVGSIAAAGVGLTLTAASTVVFAEVDWVPANMAQAEDRAHRIGQVDVVNVLHVVVERSLDARMVQLLVAKADVADRALDRAAAMVVPEAGADWGAEKREKAAAEAKKWPPVSPLLRELVQEAMQRLSENDTDYAREKNDVGFNKMDGDIGRRLAHAADPSPGMIWGIGVKFAQKYRRQLGNLSDRIADEAKLLQGDPSAPAMPVRETRAQREQRESIEFDRAWAFTRGQASLSHADPERHSRCGVMPIRSGHDLQSEISRVKREIFDAETEMEREDRARRRGRDRDEW